MIAKFNGNQLVVKKLIEDKRFHKYGIISRKSSMKSLTFNQNYDRMNS